MRFRENNPADLDRARTAVAAWREQHPAGTDDQLTAALGPQFHPGYGPVLRAVLFALDRHQACQITEVPAAPARRDPVGDQACEGRKQQQVP